jgi:hypothetical protein
MSNWLLDAGRWQDLHKDNLYIQSREAKDSLFLFWPAPSAQHPAPSVPFSLPSAQRPARFSGAFL